MTRIALILLLSAAAAAQTVKPDPDNLAVHPYHLDGVQVENGVPHIEGAASFNLQVLPTQTVQSIYRVPPPAGVTAPPPGQPVLLFYKGAVQCPPGTLVINTATFAGNANGGWDSEGGCQGILSAWYSSAYVALTDATTNNWDVVALVTTSPLPFKVHEVEERQHQPDIIVKHHLYACH